MSYNDAELEGYLTKSGGSFKSWKRRWCVLKDGFITYFKQPNVIFNFLFVNNYFNKG